MRRAPIRIGGLLALVAALAVPGRGGGDDPDYQQARPHLDALTYLIAGTGTGGHPGAARISVGIE